MLFQLCNSICRATVTIHDLKSRSPPIFFEAAIPNDFFAMVQNKLHYTIHRHTAADVIIFCAIRNNLFSAQ